MSGFTSQPRRVVPSIRMWAWVCACLLTITPTVSFVIPGSEDPQPGAVVKVLNRMVQVLETRERHTPLYERVRLLEEMLNKKTETEVRLESEMLQLRAKIPALEQKIETIPEMKKDLADFEAKIEKLVHDYEAKLSTLASEVIRLKKYGARRRVLETLSNGTDVVVRAETEDGMPEVGEETALSCPEFGLGMVAERVGHQCLYFYVTSKFNWTSAHQHCQKLGGDLAAPQDLVPLKNFLHQGFVRGPSLWLGASYNLNEEKAVDPSAAPSAEPANSLTEEKRGGLLSIPNTESNLDVSSNLLEDIEDGSSSELDPAVVSESPPNILLVKGRSNMLLDEDSSNMLLEEDSSNMLLNEDRNIMLLDEAKSILLEEGAGNLRRFLDQAAMFDEEVTGDSESFTIPRSFLKPRENSLNKLEGRESSGKGLKGRIRDPSVVDFMHLSDPVQYAAPSAESPSDQSLEERSIPGNLTVVDVLVEDLNGTSAEENGEAAEPEDGAGGQEPEDADGHETSENKGAKKATMKCMLLQQMDSQDQQGYSKYELVGRPCDELHNFVCDMKISFDNLFRD